MYPGGGYISNRASDGTDVAAVSRRIRSIAVAAAAISVVTISPATKYRRDVLDEIGAVAPVPGRSRSKRDRSAALSQRRSGSLARHWPIAHASGRGTSGRESSTAG